MEHTEKTQRIEIHGILELPVSAFPPDDEACQQWLLDDILLGDVGRLTVHSVEIGDELGTLRVTSAQPQ